VELQESGAHLEEYRELRRCTHAGRPFGDSLFVQKMEMQFGRIGIKGVHRELPRRLPLDDFEEYG